MRLIIGMSGATGAVYGVRLLQILSQMDHIQTELVISRWAEATIALETPFAAGEVRKMATRAHSYQNLAAPISSGSFPVDGMVVIPCSMKTLASIRLGLADNLLTRAADVTIKEHRRLVLVARETPLSEIHLENMLTLARMGVVILPPMPAFYNRAQTVEDLVDHTVARVLDQMGIAHQIGQRWGVAGAEDGLEGAGAAPDLRSGSLLP